MDVIAAVRGCGTSTCFIGKSGHQGIWNLYFERIAKKSIETAKNDLTFLSIMQIVRTKQNELKNRYKTGGSVS